MASMGGHSETPLKSRDEPLLERVLLARLVFEVAWKRRLESAANVARTGEIVFESEIASEEDCVEK